MKSLVLILLSIGICGYGELQIQSYRWVPKDSPRWNPFAIKESGFGRSLSRVLTEQANTAYHHGLFPGGQRRVANPFSRWLDAGNSSLGFEGRLRYRPIDKFPLKPFEVKQALQQAENKLRFAFELDPGNYTAYDAYQFFLTTEVTQTEFGTTTGGSLQNVDGDDDDDDQNKAAGDKNKAGDQADEKGVKMLAYRKEGGQKIGRQRAIEVTDKAIQKFRPSEDPERYLTGAVMWYNRFMLMAPDVEVRRNSTNARQKFDSLGFQALQKMQFYLDGAKRCEADLIAKGLWQIRPEPRTKDYENVFQFVNALARALSQALENNRAHIPGSYLGILGEVGSRSSLATNNPNGGIR
jgi:hypothetical protein